MILMSPAAAADGSGRVPSIAMLMDSMPAQEMLHQGRVCQLNYDSGGLLKQETSPAASRIVPFSTSSLPLCIGQEVSFRLRHFEDRIEAVDLQRPFSAKSERGIPVQNAFLSSLPSTRSGSTSSRFQFQIRRFQRRVLQFGNAARAEQLRLVLEAEMLLRQLLDQADLDGDSLCRLVRRCASWLHAPIVHTAATQIDTEARPVAKEPEDHWNLQRRVRKLVIKALSHLDLSDGATLRAVETALRYVALFVQRLEEKQLISQPLELHGALRQWLQLRSFLPLSMQPLCTLEVEEPQSEAPSKPSSNQRRSEGYKKAYAGTVYEPSGKTRRLSTVFQDQDRPAIELKCSECSYTVSSNWYFQHPKTLIRSVLTPRDGHNVCQQKLKKRCYWHTLDGSHAMAGISSNMEFCEQHQRLLTQCAPCGGKKMCIHGRQKYHCKDCRGNGFCSHGRRKFTCPHCQSAAERANGLRMGALRRP